MEEENRRESEIYLPENVLQAIEDVTFGILITADAVTDLAYLDERAILESINEELDRSH